MSQTFRALTLAEKLLVGAVGVWLAVFVAYKLPHLFSPSWIEWDARAMALAAFRFHGHDLFPRDLGADLASAMCPPGWKLIFWIGTLFTDPYQVSRLVPLGLFAFLCWQAFAFARGRGGLVVAAVTVFLLARCPFVWDRIVGANPRAFGLPLVVAFLRYTTEGKPRAAALVLVAQAACYPSVLLLCAPAFAVLQLVDAIRARKIMPLVLLVATGLVCGALVAPTAIFIDPRLGPAITMEQLRALKQRSIWSLYPLPPHKWVFNRAVHIALEDEVQGPLFVPAVDELMNTVVRVVCAVVFAIGVLRRRIPLAFYVVALSAVAAYFVACELAYRLYVPDRMVHYASPPILLLLFTPLAAEALGSWRRIGPRAPLVAGVALTALTVLAGNLGVSRYSGLHDWSGGRTRAIEFLGRTPREALVAAHPAVSSFVEVFSRRSTLFSGITNAPNFVQYGRTVEQRISAFYDAYYARTIEEVRAFVAANGVDYLVIDLRDFGREAIDRAKYVSPWTEYASGLIVRARGHKFALATPPEDAIAFRDQNTLVLDAKKL